MILHVVYIIEGPGFNWNAKPVLFSPHIWFDCLFFKRLSSLIVYLMLLLWLIKTNVYLIKTLWLLDVLFRAFSSTGVVETQWAIAKNLISPFELSVQEFVSCSDKAGCEGGSVARTLEWLEYARYHSEVRSVFIWICTEVWRKFKFKLSSPKYMV